jgi:lauroyl/myristoyl acyltransferase
MSILNLALLPGKRRPEQSKLLNKGFINRLELGLYHLIIVPLVAFLPAPLAYGVACLRGDLRYRWDRRSREEVMRCLEVVLGDQLSPGERARVARDYFRIRSCQPIDVLRLSGKGRLLAKLVEIRGLEHLEAALAGGKGAIIASAHFGSSASPAFSLLAARGLPITPVGRRPSQFAFLLKRSTIERFFYRQLIQKPLVHHLRRPTIEPRVGKLDMAVQAASILRQNEVIAICLDPAVAREEDRARAVQVNFLNGKALLLPGAITIAQLMGTPVLMSFMRRSADWRHQVLEISPPVPLDGDTVTAFERCLAKVEEAIRQNPAHWHGWNYFDLFWLGLLPAEEVANTNILAGSK